MRPVISPVSDPTLQKNFKNIQQALGGGLSYDNMLIQVLEGVTSDTPDSQSQIIHSMTPRPIGWDPLIGDVYVQEINDKYVDVRSTKPGVNFKIVLKGGPPVTGESLTAVGSSSYLSTTQVIQQTPVIEVTEITDATINIQPTIIRQSVNEHAGNSGLPEIAGYNQVVTDGSYFYLTSATNPTLIRINRTTGISDTLTLTGSIPYGPMVFSGTDLYVAARAFDGVSTINIERVDTTTFTSTSVAMTLVANSQNVTDIYVDGTHIYLAHATAGGINSKISKCVIAGGAGTQATLESTNCFAKKLIPDPTGTYLYVISRNLLVSTNIFKVVKSTLAIDTTYTTANNRLQMRQGVLLNGKLWMPASIDNNKATGSQDVVYGTLMVELDVVTGAFTYHPYVEIGTGQSVCDITFVSNLIENGGFLYSVSGEAGVGGCYMSRYDTLTGSQAVGWFPFPTQAGLTENQMNNVLVKDTDGSVIVTNATTSGRPRNFQWFKPDFSNVS